LSNFTNEYFSISIILDQNETLLLRKNYELFAPARCRHEVRLEFVEGTEGFVNLASDCAGGGATSVGRHALPVEGVVPDLGRVVENSTRGRLDEVFQRLIRQGRVRF